MHMIASFILCRVYLLSEKDLSLSEEKKPLKTCWQRVLPLAGSFALSVGLGNTALVYIYPSFATMLGAVSPILTMIVSAICTGKQYDHWAYSAVALMSAGVIMCLKYEANFAWIGVMACIGSALLRALKCVLQEKLLKDQKERLNSIELLYLMAPTSAAILISLSLLHEGLDPWRQLLNGKAEVNGEGQWKLVCALVVSGITACLANLAAFCITSHTSAVALQMLGNAKTVFVMIVSALAFGNEIKPMQVLGIAVCLSGGVLFNAKKQSFTTPGEPSAHLIQVCPQEKKRFMEQASTISISKYGSV